MKLIYNYLTTQTLPEGSLESHKITFWANKYMLGGDGNVYKYSFSLSLLKYIFEKESCHILDEVHEGIYDNHLRSWLLAHKIFIL